MSTVRVLWRPRAGQRLHPWILASMNPHICASMHPYLSLQQSNSQLCLSLTPPQRAWVGVWTSSVRKRGCLIPPLTFRYRNTWFINPPPKFTADTSRHALLFKPRAVFPPTEIIITIIITILLLLLIIIINNNTIPAEESRGRIASHLVR